MPDKKDIQVLTIRLAWDDYMALKRYCTETGQSLNSVVALLVRKAIPAKYREARYKYDEWDI